MDGTPTDASCSAPFRNGRAMPKMKVAKDIKLKQLNI